jgi:hypothetical protein
MSHCHCSRCRKAHGAAFATYATVPPERFRLARGRERMVRWASSPGLFRPFCARCGSVVPDGEPWQGLVGMPAGAFDDDPGARPVAHIFVASRAPWYEIRDALLRFDTYPPGFPAPALETPVLAPAGGRPRGSCLCGGVTYVVEGAPIRCNHCHCSRCRKARGAAHASNLLTDADGLRFTRGAELIETYKIPEARFFTHCFCRVCGASMPRVDRERAIAIVPMGGLDDDPGALVQQHIHVGSKAPWYEIADDLPRHDAAPPPG